MGLYHLFFLAIQATKGPGAVEAWIQNNKLTVEKSDQLMVLALSNYLKTVLAVLLFAKVRGLVMFESPRTFVKITTAKTVLR